MHGQHPPAGGPAQREEQQDADLAEEGVGGVVVQPVGVQVGQAKVWG
jgi:hypothetical protein